MRKTNNKWHGLSKLLMAVCLIAGLSTTAKAQIAQGTSFVGGIANFSYSNAEPGSGNFGDALITNFSFLNSIAADATLANIRGADVETFEWEIVPEVGYFISDRFAIGLGAGFRWIQTTLDATATLPEAKTKAWLIPIIPFVRYYAPLGDDGRGGLWFGIAANFEFGKTEFEEDGVDLGDGPDLFAFQPRGEIAFYYFVTPNFGIEGIWSALSYTLLNSDPEVGDSADAYSFDIGADLNDFSIGAKWYFYR